MEKILIVVDMQNDFVTGALGTAEARLVLPRIVAKVKNAGADTFVIFTQDTHSQNYMDTREGQYLPVPHCIKNTEGWELCEPLKNLAEKLPQEHVICKDTFGGKELVNTIARLLEQNEIKTIELAGVCTDICVVSNALLLKTYFPEMDFAVDAECCAGVTPETHNAALTVLKSCHIRV